MRNYDFKEHLKEMFIAVVGVTVFLFIRFLINFLCR